jgi:hypothetical protein
MAEFILEKIEKLKKKKHFYKNYKKIGNFCDTTNP